MSRWLVDTQALLWFLADDRRLSHPARTTMQSGSNDLLVSVASLWELAIKTALGKLEAPDDLPAVIVAEGFEFLPVAEEHAWRVRALEMGRHRDPFDRLLVAQALVEELGVISSDPQLDEYGVQRLW